jgi:hypothetical protein
MRRLIEKPQIGDCEKKRYKKMPALTINDLPPGSTRSRECGLLP